VKSQSIVRLVLGVVFASAGFYISSFVFASAQENSRLGFQIVSAFVSAGVGMFLVPLVQKWFIVWSGAFSRRVASEVISQLRIPRFSNPVGGRMNKDNRKWINPMVVDTSALIDGRLLEVVESGFLFGTLIVPDFVLSELQHIADSADKLKRGKGRRGFEVVETIKKSKNVKTVIYDTGNNSLKNVDDRLLKLGKGWKAKIITTDFNLNKVASVSDVKILNVNELSNSIKVQMIPGEEINVKVIQEGKEKSQGVAYLPDGTMIVVEQGAIYLGKNVTATVSRVLQTAAGRMIFAKTAKS
jgi:uncharacterized protein YacL